MYLFPQRTSIVTRHSQWGVANHIGFALWKGCRAGRSLWDSSFSHVHHERLSKWRARTTEWRKSLMVADRGILLHFSDIVRSQSFNKVILHVERLLEQLLRSEQHGFWPHRSICHQILVRWLIGGSPNIPYYCFRGLLSTVFLRCWPRTMLIQDSSEVYWQYQKRWATVFIPNGLTDGG